MAYLQLAEDLYLSEDASEMYVFIPAGYRGAPKDMYVREDYFDGMSDYEFSQIMDELEPYQPMLSARADRKAKKAQRRADRKAKREAKRSTSKAAQRQAAKLERIKARQAGKTERAAMGGGFGGALDKIGGIASNILGGGAGADQGIDAGIDGSIDFSAGDMQAPKKNWIPWAVGGAVVVGGLIFVLTRKK